MDNFKLNTLCAGENFNRKRVGRGIGSGTGKTAGRGHKGAKARCGRVSTPFFEGGQMPIYRRFPKRGFKSKFDRTMVAEVNLFSIQSLIDAGKIDIAEEINIDVLKSAGAVRDDKTILRILGGVQIEKPIKIKSHYITKNAKEMLEKVGSVVEVI